MAKIYLEHLVRFQGKYLLGLALVVLLVPVMANLVLGKPLIMNPESYYHLQQARNLSLNNFYYFPLEIISLLLPLDFLIIAPLFMALSAIFFTLSAAKETVLKGEFIFFFLLFMILSPAFIYNFSILSANAYFIFLLAFGFYLLSRKTYWLNCLSLIPFLLASFFNLLFTLLVILTLSVYGYSCWQRQRQEKFLIFITAALILVFLSGLISIIVLSQPFLPAQFNEEGFIASLISAFGSVSGISFFMIILALIGLAVTWKKKGFSYSYLFLALLLSAQIFSSQIVFLTSIVIIFLATVSFTLLLSQSWKLPVIKQFTVLLLMLGFFFSTLSYLNRINENSPLAAQEETLTWIRGNTPANFIVFSSSDNIDYINYFARRHPFQQQYKNQTYALEKYNAIINAGSVEELRYLLGTNQITVIYVTPQMRQTLSKTYGLLVWLNTETFKLVYSSGGFEVWVYQKQAQPAV